MKLDNQINNLPKHSVGLDLWSKIESRLESFSQATSWVDKLPLHKASAELWFDIDTRLYAKHHTRRIRLQALATAASLLLVLTLGSVFYEKSTTDYLVYSDEIYFESEPVPTYKAQHNDVLDNCDNHPAVCKTPNFTRLKNNLEHLKQEEEKLRMMKESMNDPKLDVYHTRIVRDIQQLEEQLMQMFI